MVILSDRSGSVNGEHEEWIALEQYGGNSNIICFLISG